ncbi:MAG: hypothetical protein WCJ30_07555 [Deltaproteobacteria bacterium]
MNTALGWLHGILAAVLSLGAIATASRPAHLWGRRAAGISGLAALGTLAWGAWRIRAWEPGYRRAVYLASQGAGAWLDRKMHLGVAACCFAIAAMFTAADRDAPPWLLRLLAALSLVFACGAWLALTYVRARVPVASLE